ncbi:MAG: hypothetical protein M3N08_06355 [Pseudomonadota bacterium]|nr:hypothetical protein [Pseudomonadota bacterium]
MRWLILLSLYIALAGCGGPALEATTFTAPESAGGRLCVSQCGQAHDYCRQDCSFKQRDCSNKVQAQALNDYEKYMSERFLHAEAVELRPRDFEHMEACDSALRTCSATCESPYQSCYRSCGGSVDISSSCRFMCF